MRNIIREGSRIVGGRVAGSWKKRIGKSGVEMRLSPFKKLTKTEMAALRDQADRYGEFLGLKAMIIE